MVNSVKNATIVNDDNLTVSGILPEKTFDIVVFDPPFESVYDGPNYENFLKERIESSTRLLDDTGNFISVNYPQHSEYTEKVLTNEKLYKSWKMTIPIVRRRKSSKDRIIIQSFSRKSNLIGDIVISEIKHRAGNNGVIEAMPSWETEAIMYLNNTDPNDNVLDMFGGGGTIPLTTNALGANCISIEKNIPRYYGILQSLTRSSSSRKCSFLTCKKHGIVFKDDIGWMCQNHYSRYNLYSKSKRNAFLGLDANHNPIETGNMMSSMINTASLLLNKAERLKSTEKKRELFNTALKEISKRYGQGNITKFTEFAFTREE